MQTPANGWTRVYARACVCVCIFVEANKKIMVIYRTLVRSIANCWRRQADRKNEPFDENYRTLDKSGDGRSGREWKLQKKFIVESLR